MQMLLKISISLVLALLLLSAPALAQSWRLDDRDFEWLAYNWSLQWDDGSADIHDWSSPGHQY
jgi:hypothetical protein